MICKNSEYLSVQGVMIDLFSSGNIHYFINFVWTSLFLQNKMFLFFIMTYIWSGKTANLSRCNTTKEFSIAFYVK
jgi:hypothetical protein